MIDTLLSRARGRRWMGRLAAAGAALALAAGLAGCGGGDRDEPFKPTRMFVYGDEYSAITSLQRYTVNYRELNTTTSATAYRCGELYIWVQYVAGHYGFQLDACPITNAAPAGFVRAQPGYLVNNVASTINADLGQLRKGDLVTLLAGANDIRQAYQSGSTLETKKNTVREAGRTLGQKTRDITATGARVLLLTVPDLGFTPYAIAENIAAAGSAATASQVRGADCADNPGSNERQKILAVLTACFNNGLRTTLENDGNKLALVTADQLIQLMANNLADYGLAEGVRPLCASASPFVPANCFIELSTTGATTANTLTQLTPGATLNDVTTYWLWAGDIYLSPAGNGKLASAALSRAQTNWE